jgi:formamidopyrimidine-DNA glycosylase
VKTPYGTCLFNQQKAMPEIAEVETICRQLNDVVTKQRLVGIEILDSLLQEDWRNKSKLRTGLPGAGLFENTNPEGAREKETTITGVKRLGKAILFRFDNGLAALLHLRMTGRLLYAPAGEQSAPNGNDGNIVTTSGLNHVRMIWHLSEGMLFLIDPRRFATLVVDSEDHFAEPPNDAVAGIQAGYLVQIACKRRLPVKSLLMDQRLIAGIGNIYACEILFAARIDPRRPACDLTKPEWQRLSESAAKIIKKAVVRRGTTVSDWRDLYGRPGKNQHYLKVYGHQGETCSRCGGKIERIVQNGRGTWFCRTCQH